MKKHMIEQALTDIDPVFVAEAGAACTAATVRRPAWKRTLLVAACLTLAFAITAGASTLLNTWDVEIKPDAEGNPILEATIVYGGTVLPEESKQLVREKAEGLLDENGHADVEFSFDTLEEMEAFLGAELLKSDVYPISTEEEIRCTVHYQTGYKMYAEGVRPYESLSMGFGSYGFDTGERVDYVNFHFRETPCFETPQVSSLVGLLSENSKYYQRELPRLNCTAFYVTKMGIHQDLSALYLTKGDIVYHVSYRQGPKPPVKFTDSLY